MTVHLDREAIRCLKFLAKEKAQLGWPCRNSTIPWLIDRGLALKARNFKAIWNDQEHDCAEIIITEAGRKALANTGSMT